MARPIQEGLGYFPLDTNFYQNRKIRRLMRAQGEKSLGVWVVLMAMIYADKGYYLNFDKDVCFDIADVFGVTEGAIEEFVKAAINARLFNSYMFDHYQVLTSKGIQEQYEKITKDAKRKNTIKEEYRIPSINDEVNSEETRQSSEETYKKREESTQIKEKEIKENKTKTNSSNARAKINQLYQQKIKPMDSYQNIDRVQSFLEDGLPLEVIELAIEISARDGGTSAGYVVKKLNDWLARGVQTVEDAKKADENWKGSFKKRYGSKPLENEGSNEYDNLPF